MARLPGPSRKPGSMMRMGDGGRKAGGGNSQQTIRVDTNTHGEDLHGRDKNVRTQKTVAEVHTQKRGIVVGI